MEIVLSSNRNYVPLSEQPRGTVGVTETGTYLMHINPTSVDNPSYLNLANYVSYPFKVNGEQMVHVFDAKLELS